MKQIIVSENEKTPYIKIILAVVFYYIGEVLSCFQWPLGMVGTSDAFTIPSTKTLRIDFCQQKQAF